MPTNEKDPIIDDLKYALDDFLKYILRQGQQDGLDLIPNDETRKMMSRGSRALLAARNIGTFVESTEPTVEGG